MERYTHRHCTDLCTCIYIFACPCIIVCVQSAFGMLDMDNDLVVIVLA